METSSYKSKSIRPESQSTRPEIEQLLFATNKDLHPKELERILFSVRKKIEKRATEESA